MVSNITIWSFLEPFLYTKEYMHLADISQQMGKPHTTVRQYLSELEKQGVLTKSTKGRLTLYKINPAAPLIIDYLTMAEKEKLIHKTDKDLLLKELVSLLHNCLEENCKAVIFGSATTSTKKANDIDLLIAGETQIKDKLKEFEKKYNKKIHFINTKSLTEVSQSMKTEISKKHLIIQGSEEITKWLL